MQNIYWVGISSFWKSKVLIVVHGVLYILCYYDGVLNVSYHPFRKGSVIVKNSTQNDWIYIVMNVSTCNAT